MVAEARLAFVERHRKAQSKMYSPTQVPLCVAVCIFFALSNCGATILTTYAGFTKGKAVSTSHTTFQPYSEIQCVRRCFE